MTNRFFLTSACLAMLAGCATSAQDIAGIDAASSVVQSFSNGLEAAHASQLARASSVREDERRLYVLTQLASGSAPAFESAMCGGYSSYAELQRAAEHLQTVRSGLNRLAGPSPTTVVELVAAHSQGTAPGIPPQPVPSGPAIDDICKRDAGMAAFAYDAVDRGRVPVAGAVLDAVQVFTSIVRPVLLRGLTQADRARRLQALREWADDSDNGLPRLRERLHRAQQQAEEAAAQERVLAAGDAYLAWLALDEARRQAAAAPICTPQHQRLETACVAAMERRFQREMDAFLAAARKYDQTVDVDPTRALRASLRAADRLDSWLGGEMSAEETAAVQAAAFAAMTQWLGVLADAEDWWEDEAVKRRLSQAADNLQVALGGGS